jgi:hypothetical protein
LPPAPQASVHQFRHDAGAGFTGLRKRAPMTNTGGTRAAMPPRDPDIVATVTLALAARSKPTSAPRRASIVGGSAAPVLRNAWFVSGGAVMAGFCRTAGSSTSPLYTAGTSARDQAPADAASLHRVGAAGSSIIMVGQRVSTRDRPQSRAPDAARGDLR